MIDRLQSNRIGVLSLCLITVSLVTAACGGPETRPTGPPFARLTEMSAIAGGEILTLGADLPELRTRLAESPADELTVTYLSAELDLLEGQIRRGFFRFGDVVSDQPNSLLGILSALRLVEFHDTVAGRGDVISDVRSAVSGLRLNPLTAVYLNMLVLQDEWSRLEHLGATPSGRFSGGPYGLPDEWRKVGPFSPFPRQHLDRYEPYRDDLVLADDYTLDGQQIRTRPSLGNQPALQLFVIDPGTHLYETWAHFDTSSRRIAVLESNNGVRVTVDDQLVISRDEIGEYRPTVLMRPVEFRPGWHRIRVLIGAVEGEQDFRFRLVPEILDEPGLTFAPRPPDGVVMGSLLVGEAPSPTLEQLLPENILEPTGPVEAYALLQLASAFHSEAMGERAMEFFQTFPDRSPMVLVEIADFVGAQPSRAPMEQINLSLQLLRQALALAPSAGGAAFRLALFMAMDGRDDEALRIVQPFEERLASEPYIAITLHYLYSFRGWDELAEATLLRLLEVDPDQCRAIEELARLYEYRDHYPPLTELPSGFQTCEEGLLYQIDHLMLPSNRLEPAIAAIQALSDRHPENSHLQRRLYDLLMMDGQLSQAFQQLETASVYAIDAVERALIEADWYLSQDRDDEALGRLEALLQGENPGDYRLHRAASHLQHDSVLGDLRIDTVEAIEEYREREVDQSAGVVYALDYAAYRYFEDGSSISVTHQILHVLSRESLGTYGEVAVPGSALLLRARTIKADGTILEPDNIPGKDSISMPSLEVGDFVEYEYLELSGPSQIHTGTTIGPRFYFQVFDAPLARSEMIVDVPTSWSELTLDLRGGAPEPEVSELGDFRRYHFLVHDSMPPVDEPATPNYDELLPSVRIGYLYDWKDVRDFFIDFRLAVVRSTPDIVTVTHELLQGAEDDEERTRRLFRFVVDDIEEIGGFLSSDAIWTLRLGEGERLPLLLTMLEIADIEAQIVFLRSWSDDQTDSAIPNAAAFPHTAVRVQLEDKELWLYPSNDYSHFDYLGPHLQGVDGIVIADSADTPVEWITTPIWPSDTNRHHVELSLAIEEDGRATALVREGVPLRSAGAARSALERVQDERDLVAQLEGGLSSSFPGVTVDEVNVEAASTADLPLTFEYTFSTPRFARAEEGALVIDTRIFDRQLRSMLGLQSERVYPLSIGYPFVETMNITIELPQGYRFTDVPAELNIGRPWFEYSWAVTEGGNGHETIRLVRNTDVPVSRVSTDDYPAFLEILGAVDEAESLHLRAVRED